MNDDDFPDFDGDGLPHTCQRCGGEGVVIVCIDDMCRGSGECFHGDGEEICPECGGEGNV